MQLCHQYTCIIFFHAQDEPDTVKRAEQFVDYMYRRTYEDFALLCQALYETGQNNLVVSVFLQPDFISVAIDA